MVRVTVSSGDGKITNTVANEIAALLESLKVGITLQNVRKQTESEHDAGVLDLRGEDAVIVGSVGP